MKILTDESGQLYTELKAGKQTVTITLLRNSQVSVVVTNSDGSIGPFKGSEEEKEKLQKQLKETIQKLVEAA